MSFWELEEDKPASAPYTCPHCGKMWTIDIKFDSPSKIQKILEHKCKKS